nr:hypothetical protein [Oscillatoria sp. PCC 10802]
MPLRKWPSSVLDLAVWQRRWRCENKASTPKFQGSRAYDADSDTFQRTAMERAQASQPDFEDWLYNYNRSVIS